MWCLKQLGRFALMNHNIYIARTPLMWTLTMRAGGPTMFTQRMMTTHLLKIKSINMIDIRYHK